MNEQTFLTFSELEDIFENKKNLHTNLNGIELEITDTFSACARLWKKDPLRVSLYAEFQDTDPELPGKLKLYSDSDLDRIDEAELWKHYKEGDGYVWGDLDDFLGTPLEFSVIGGKTVVKTYDGSYFDEVDEVWDTVTPFRDYVRNNIQKIYMAEEEKAEALG